MKHKVGFRPQAEDDLFELYRYIAEDAGLAIAAGYIDRIEAACLGLETFFPCGARRGTTSAPVCELRASSAARSSCTKSWRTR